MAESDTWARPILLRTLALVGTVYAVLLTAGAPCQEVTSSSPSPTPTAPDRLQEAFYREVALADPAGAVRLYQELASDATTPSAIRARAHLRLGICYRLLGNAQASRRELETVVASYPLELEAVKLARSYLGDKVTEDPARFMPQDILAYVELVRPAEHVRALSALLRGTPFENPVDYYVSYLGRRRSGEPATESDPAAALRTAAPAAAFLNEGFLRELQKIEGLAVAIPGERRSPQDFVAVFLPGTSDILRGILQMLLTFSNASGVGVIEDLPLLRVPPQGETPPPEDPDDWLHVALGPSTMVAGRPRTLVEAAVRRWSTGTESLADDPDFRRAQAARAGSLLFSYLSSSRITGLLRQSVPPRSRATFDATRDLLGWNDVNSLSFTVSHAASNDSLRLAFRARFDGDRLQAWSAFRTPVLEPTILQSVPAGCPGFLAFDLDGEPPLPEVVSMLLGALPEPPATRGQTGLKTLREILQGQAFADFMGEVEGIVAGVGPEGDVPRPLRGFLVFRFRDADRGQETLERFVVALFDKLVASPAARTFESEELELAGQPHQVRFVEPFPNVRLRFLRLEERVVVSFSRKSLGLAAAGPAVSPELVPHRASKIVYLKIAPLLKALPDLPPEIESLLAELKLGLLSTREGENSLSVTLTLPAITPAARAILDKLAKMRALGATGQKSATSTPVGREDPATREGSTRP